MHGNFGEDGAMQGFLEVLRLPYIGCGITSSTICLDKAIFKDVARAHNLPQTQYAVLDLLPYRENHHEAIQSLLKEIPFPWIIKPTRSGSSLGVSRVKHKSDIQPALEESFQYGNQLIIEEALSEFAELEMGVIGNADDLDSVQVSLVGEANYEGDCQTSSVKYSENGTQFSIPAKLPEHALHECRTLALRAFRLFHCEGMARVDVMYDRTRKVVLLNEINTVPGLTEQSMFLQLWEKSGLSCEELMGRLMDLAVDRDEARF
jgi:D-alanine-D-alanine ligase